MQLLTLARDLKRRKARERQSLFVAEGVRTVEELLRSSLNIEGALTTAALSRTPRGEALLTALAGRGVAVTEVAEAEFLSAAETDHPQGVLAIAAIREQPLGALTLPPVARLLVLDGVQDPGNVGTLVRTSAALGVAAVIALPGTADPWSAKAVRSAVGAQFRLRTCSAESSELLSFLTAQRVALWGSASDGAPVESVTPPARLALAVGNEGAGLSEALRAAATLTVSLPMRGEVESLNVAVAAGILMYALRVPS